MEWCRTPVTTKQITPFPAAVTAISVHCSSSISVAILPNIWLFLLFFLPNVPSPLLCWMRGSDNGLDLLMTEKWMQIINPVYKIRYHYFIMDVTWMNGCSMVWSCMNKLIPDISYSVWEKAPRGKNKKLSFVGTTSNNVHKKCNSTCQLVV